MKNPGYVLHDIDLTGAEEDGYYVVNVKFNRHNPMHRAIMCVAARGNLKTIMSAGLEDPAARVGAMNYVRVVSKIQEL